MEIMNDNEVESVERIVRMNATPIVGATDNPFICVPKECELKSIEHFNNSPGEIRISETFSEVSSFLEYVGKFKNEQTMLFDSDVAITAFINYHGVNKPSWNRHIVNLKYRTDEIFRAWLERDGRWCSQDDFAEFLELNTLGIVEPTAAEVLQVAKTLEANSRVAFRSAVRTQNGDVQFMYDKSTEAKAGERGELSVPEKIVLTIPVYQGALSTMITMKLFFRIGDGDKKLSFRVQMLDKFHVIEMAKKQLRSEIEQNLGIKILR